jgi:hypothetical protein
VKVPLLTIDDFFALAKDDHCLAPNLEPHPTAAQFQEALIQLRDKEGIRQVLLDVVEYDGDAPIADGIVVVTSLPAEAFQSFADLWHADGVITPDRQTLRRLPETQGDDNIWKIVWD